MECSQTNAIFLQLKNVKCVSLQNRCCGYEDLQNAIRYNYNIVFQAHSQGGSGGSEESPSWEKGPQF